MNNAGLVKVEVLQASNTKVLAMNNTRISLEKGYGIMTPIASFEVGVEDILNAMNYKPKIHAHWVNEGFLDMYCSHCGETPDSESGSCPTPTDFCPFCGAEMDGDFPQIIDDTPTIETEPINDDWISVKDRLPEPRTWVLAYIEYPSPVFELERGIRKTGNIRKMFYDGFYDALGNYKVGDCKVTHWQPLPEPPKGE